MKTILIIIVSATLAGSCLIKNDSRVQQLVSLKAVLQGTYGKSGISGAESILSGKGEPDKLFQYHSWVSGF